jgi:plasmid stabilization system protein ParE
VNPVIRPAARDDIIRQFQWYLIEQDAHDAAFRFVDAVDESVRRVWPVKGFDEFLIFYIVQMETLKVVRVLHGKRDLSTILKKEPAEGDPVP